MRSKFCIMIYSKVPSLSGRVCQIETVDVQTHRCVSRLLLVEVSEIPRECSRHLGTGNR